MDSQKFCLKWDSFQSSVTSLFDSLRRDGELVDVTLCCEGQQVRAHRMMLSACSPYFRELLKANQCQQMAIFLKDTSVADLNAIIEFMYKGSVNVSQSQLPSFIKTAEMLQIRGLSGDEEKGAPPPSPRRAPPPPPPAVSAPTPPHKRRRLSGGSASGGRGSPVSPGRRPRTPTPPPFAPPPQLHPPPVLPSVTPHMGATPEQHAPPPMPAAAAAPLSHSVKAESNKSMKVEKIDLTEDDDDASLDSALYNVGEYEGAGGHTAEYDGSGDHAAEYDESYDGSNSGMDHMSFMPAGGDMDGVPPPGAGPSQGPPRTRSSHDMSPLTPGSQSGEDGSASGLHACDICGRRYASRDTMVYHRKVHAGLTTCQVCGKVYSKMAGLRRHMQIVHDMSAEETRALAPPLQRTYEVPRGQ